MNLSQFILSTSLVCLLATPVLAQRLDPAGAAQRSNLELFRNAAERDFNQGRIPESLAQRLSQLPDEQEQPPLKPGEGPSFQLKEIVFNESELLTDDELKKAADKYVGRKVTLGHLYELLGDIRKLYRAKGQTGATAVLPPQKIQGGKLQIQLIEARIGAVEIKGNKRLSTRYLESALNIGSLGGKVLDLPKLERRLARFNKTNLTSVNATLQPGKDFGETNITLDAVEPKPYEVLASYDNSGRDNLGTQRSLALVRLHNLARWSDTLVLSGTYMEGAQSIYAAYDFPILPRYGTRLVVSFTGGQIEVVDGPQAALDIRGSSHTVDVHIDQPLWVTTQTKVISHLGYIYNDSESNLADFTLEEVSGHAVSAGFSLERQDRTGLWYAFTDLKWGTTSTLREQLEYYVFNWSVSRAQRITNSFHALLSVGGQWSSQENLPSIEEFQIGGLNSVRGYPEGLLFGHNAWYARAELGYTLPFGQSKVGKFFTGSELFAFFDYGAVEEAGLDFDRLPSDIASAGGGLRLRLGEHFSAAVTYAHPFTDIGDEYDDHHVLFRVEASF